MSSSEPSLVLGGLDGSNPLGFMAAVGLLRTVSQADPQNGWRMRWVTPSGWRPVLCGKRAFGREELVDLLVNELGTGSRPELRFAADLNIAPSTFAEVASDAQRCASCDDRSYADYVAAFGSEVLLSDGGRTIQDTALRTMSGAGHQHFLGTMKDLVDGTGADHLRRSLFEPWDYSDKRCGLRWDPQEDRRFALRWDNPSGHAPGTMHGANRLAMEALPLLPCVPVKRQLETTGFVSRGRSTVFSWPIWVCGLGLEVVRSLLASPRIQSSEPDRTVLLAMGVSEVFRSLRLTTGKYRNFTHARPA